MENIIELGSEIDRENETTISATAEITDSRNTQCDDNSVRNLASGIDQQRCCQAEQSTSECDEQGNDNSRENRTNSSRTFKSFKMNMLVQYGKELLGFLALVLTTYATLLNKEPVIGGTLTPKPIFAKDSIVQEWPYGHLVDVQSKVAVSELSLIFFYAPWCAESLFAKKVYNSVANLYRKEAYFAAVNCWQPNSGCRTYYSNVYKWPVLMAYLPNGFSVQYNGAWNYNSLAIFLDRLLMPIVRINDVRKLTKLRIAYDAVALGIFNSSDCKEYKIFFQTAVKWLESNAFQNVKFAVYIGEKTSMFIQSEDMEQPVIKLFTTNNTIVYNNTKWVSRKIIYLIKQNLANIWINLPSAKSSAMNAHLQKGPVLLMFAPRIPTSYHYFIMKQLLYTVETNQQGLNNTVLNEYITHTHKEHPVKRKKMAQFCGFTKRTKYIDIETALHDVGVWEDRLFSLGIQTVNTSNNIASNPNLSVGSDSCNYCDKERMKKKVYQQVGVKFNAYTTDCRSPLEILKNYLQKKCFNLERIPHTLFQKNTIEPIDPSMLLEPDYRKNRTLSFHLLDSVLHNDYLRNFIGEFGIKQHPSQSPALFILDNQKESLYMQKGPISTRSAIDFLNNFYKGKLRRHLRSSTKTANNHTSMNSVISIREINSREFTKVINSTNVTSIMLFYSPQCALCYVMSQILLHVSNIMQVNNIKFYRIDGSTNDVCWEYTMDKYPTLIVFPENRTTETNVFPPSLEINVKNVFGFILSKMKHEEQLTSLINACRLTKVSAAFQSCARHVRMTIDSEIYRYLQQWNRSFSRREFLLKRLTMLKKMYLDVIQARKGTDLESILRYYNI